MNKIQILSKAAQDKAPIIGILAFSLASVNSVANLFLSRALHPTPILYAPAVLIELVTAWSVYQVVEMARKLTQSRITKQDRRFYTGVLLAFVGVSVPLVSTSVWANVVEFGGSVALGLLFPVASIGCAIGAALPSVTGQYRKQKQTQAQDAARVRKQRAEEKQRAAELDTKSRIEQAEKERVEAESRRVNAETLASLGKSLPVFKLYQANGRITQAEAAQALGIKRQSVGYHLDKLEALGVIRRNGGGVVLNGGAEVETVEPLDPEQQVAQNILDGLGA